ncbi:ATP-binding cassette domain-containing protein [Campylobacter corcagiensis]|uniref:ATP-binding cassette domain-containing protein n=1 Tax=Campylobacter corcagiensis TaxID=1448857 RepID=UPI0039E87E5E
MSHLKERIFTNLSGGEKQLVYLARVLSSKAKIIFMDEPVSGLDFGNQIKLLNLIKTLSKVAT